MPHTKLKTDVYLCHMAHVERKSEFQLRIIMKKIMSFTDSRNPSQSNIDKNITINRNNINSISLGIY